MDIRIKKVIFHIHCSGRISDELVKNIVSNIRNKLDEYLRNITLNSSSKWEEDTLIYIEMGDMTLNEFWSCFQSVPIKNPVIKQSKLRGHSSKPSEVQISLQKEGIGHYNLPLYANSEKESGAETVMPRGHLQGHGEIASPLPDSLPVGASYEQPRLIGCDEKPTHISYSLPVGASRGQPRLIGCDEKPIHISYSLTGVASRRQPRLIGCDEKPTHISYSLTGVASRRQPRLIGCDEKPTHISYSLTGVASRREPRLIGPTHISYSLTGVASREQSHLSDGDEKRAHTLCRISVGNPVFMKPSGIKHRVPLGNENTSPGEAISSHILGLWPSSTGGARHDSRTSKGNAGLKYVESKNNPVVPRNAWPRDLQKALRDSRGVIADFCGIALIVPFLEKFLSSHELTVYHPSQGVICLNPGYLVSLLSCWIVGDAGNESRLSLLHLMFPGADEGQEWCQPEEQHLNGLDEMLTAIQIQTPLLAKFSIQEIKRYLLNRPGELKVDDGLKAVNVIPFSEPLDIFIRHILWYPSVARFDWNDLLFYFHLQT